MKGLGWRKEHADPRDFLHGDIAGVSNRVQATAETPEVDFFKWIPPIKDQGHLGSCVAHGIAGAYEFDGIKTTGRSMSVSRLYLKRRPGDWEALAAIPGPVFGTECGPN